MTAKAKNKTPAYH